MTYNVYLVGGALRDEILGTKPKDYDYVIEAPDYGALRDFVISIGGEIRVEDPEFLRIGAMAPDWGRGLIDFVCSRSDGQYSDGRHPDNVVVGNIYDDLARRDFTMNAIARNVYTGEMIDPYNGVEDIERGIVRCTVSARKQFGIDPLRLLRAIRFAITKGFKLSLAIRLYLLFGSGLVRRIAETVSEERIYEEFMKMFRHDTPSTLRLLARYPKLMTLFSNKGDGLWLMPTTRK